MATMLINHLGLDKFCNTVIKMNYPPRPLLSHRISPIWFLIPRREQSCFFWMEVQQSQDGHCGSLVSASFLGYNCFGTGEKMFTSLYWVLITFV